MKTKFCLQFAVAALALWHPNSAQSQNINPAAGSTILPNEGKAEGFVMINNRVHIVRQGVATPLEEEMVLRVTPSGILGFDQMSRVISNNAMLTMDGRIVAAPQVRTMPPALMANEPDISTGSSYVVYGTNFSGLAPSRTTANRSGPRFISTKKSPTVKARSTTVRKSTAKRQTAAAATSAPPSFPSFDDDVLRLPNPEFDTAAAANPTIDATSTMLYMTAAPNAAWSPEAQSIKASLGITTDSQSQAELPAVTAPLPPLPPTLQLPAAPATKEEAP